MARLLPRLALVAFSACAWCVLAAPATRVLFPTNLHLTRQIDDPVSRKTVTIDEYCSGNRMVAISGNKTVVVDYAKQEITEIDRAAGTYSVSRFDEIASATSESSAAAAIAPSGEKRQWKMTPLGVRGAAGRSVERYELVDEGEVRRKVDVGIDRSVPLTREAVEVLIGAAYPNPVREEHEAVLRAAGPRSGERVAATNDAGAKDDQPEYGLPVTQEYTYSESGSELTFRVAITRVGAEAAPADAVIIPPAARRVESPAATVRRQLRELDHPEPPKE